MTPLMNIATFPARQRGSEDIWLDAACDLLAESGVDAVKVMALAKRLGLTRTGFYWHFRDRDALLEAMIRRWEDKNTGNLVERAAAYADGICEAMLNLFDCWLDEALFDSRLDLAIRNWARNDVELQRRLDTADARRLRAVCGMFERFGYAAAEAEVRSMVVLYTQIGYFSMQAKEAWPDRMARIGRYVDVFTGLSPTEGDLERFFSRHYSVR